MNNQQGMILPSTLLIISLLALITLAQLQLFFLQIKATNQISFEKNIFKQLEKEASLLLVSKAMQKECLIHKINANKVIQGLQHQQGCLVAIDNGSYRFMIEDMGIFPCLKIRVNHSFYASRHWRLTMITDDAKHSLQLRIAKKGPNQLCEQQDFIVMRPGVISWRYLNE